MTPMLLKRVLEYGLNIYPNSFLIKYHSMNVDQLQKAFVVA
jgi:hypothetical protein